MAKAAITEQYLTDIADAIRTKTGQSTATYYPSLMAPAILTISGSGGITPTGTININTNGTHNVTNYASANVSVPNSYAAGDEGKVVSNGALVSQTSATYTSNNIYDTTTISLVTVNVSGGGSSSPNLQAKTGITPTESSQTIEADNGYDGLSSVQINGISSTYVGSSITNRNSSDLLASGATVTAPAGYYASSASKSVTTMTLPTATSSSATSGYTSKATVSRSTADQYINIPPGYNSAGGYYKVSAVANGSATGPSSLSGSSATVTTGTNTITLTKTGVTTTPTVSAGYVSSATASTATVTLTASVTTKAAATITPKNTSQTIASGTYLTGTQTIEAVTTSNLTAANIASGVTVKVGTATDDDSVASVTGSLSFINVYTGSSAPSSSTGSNGDIYIQS